MKKPLPILIVSGLLVVSLAGNVVQVVHSQQQIANSEKQISELQAEFSSLEKLNDELSATANQAKQDVDTFKTAVTNLERELETFKQEDLSEKNKQCIFGKTVGLTDKELETFLGSDYKPSDEVLEAVKNIPSAQSTTPKTTTASSKPTGDSSSSGGNGGVWVPPPGFVEPGIVTDGSNEMSKEWIQGGGVGTIPD